MNIIYFERDELYTIKDKELECVDFPRLFSTLKQGAVFIIDEKQRLLGYINDSIYKETIKKNRFKYSCQFEYVVVDSKEEILGLEKVLKDDLKPEFLAIVDRNGIFLGAYVRTFPEELIAYDRLMQQIALASLPAFKEELAFYMLQQGYDRILVAGDADEYDVISNALGEKIVVEKYVGYNLALDNRFTVIIDFIYSKTYRTLHFFSWHEAAVVKMEDVLAASIVDAVFKYVKSRNAAIYFVEGPVKDKLEEAERRWPSMYSGKSLTHCVCDKELLHDFCNGDADMVSWMQDPVDGVLAGARVTTNGIHLMTADHCGNQYTCAGGVRIGKTYRVGVPTIHMYGPCLTFGSCVPDVHTVQYYLSETLDRHDSRYNVLNYGVKNGHSNLNDFLYILNTELNSGDVVICLNVFNAAVYEQVRNYADIYVSSDYLNCVDDGMMKFLDMSFHVNYAVNRHLSDYIYSVICGSLTRTHVATMVNGGTYLSEKRKLGLIDSTAVLSKGLLKSYVEYLKKNRRDIPENSIVGAVLITANPMTKGHEFLIDYAKKRCDVLYVFVVEEDLFYFSTSERMMLVKEVIKDPDVIVLTTGNLMTARFTFPEYFTKDKDNMQQSANLMPELHFCIFGSVISPLLGIGKRFVGAEIPGTVTDIYNEKLKRYLPSYGVEVEVVERVKTADDHVISASDVRRMIEVADFEQLYKLLPSAVVDYVYRKWSVKR